MEQETVPATPGRGIPTRSGRGVMLDEIMGEYRKAEDTCDRIPESPRKELGFTEETVV